jgi:5'-methylthioadenosine phosphorylase
MKNQQAQIGIFGGSGFYDLLRNGREVEVITPYGKPSDKIFLGEYEGKKLAFLPRHGKHHQYPPHLIPYRANLYAFKMLGVKHIIAPTAAGSLQPKIKPSDFVVCDQFLDKTHGRESTFFEGNQTKNRFSKARVVHASPAQPYCEDLRSLAIKAGKKLKIKIHPKGTVVVINGPRFASRAESEYFQKQGWEVINMTQYPECVLAKELEMCYLNISLITDYDVGLIGQKGIKAVSVEDVLKVMKENNEKVKNLIFEIIKNLSDNTVCLCDQALKGAIIS